MAIWIKTNGNEIELNDEPATIAYAESLGWEKKKGRPAKKKDKKAE
jgi:hypothetical protein